MPPIGASAHRVFALIVTWTNNRTVRVLHVIDSLRMGGAEALLAALVRELDIHGWVESSVCAVSAQGSDQDLVASLRRHASELEFLHGRRLYDPRILGGLLRAQRRSRADLVHSHLSTANVNARVAARLVGRPHVTTIHTPPGPGVEDSRLRAMADGVTAHLSTRIVSPSQEVAHAYAAHYRLPPSRFCVIPNAPAALPADACDRTVLRKELFGSSARHVVVCIARLQQEKGIDELIDATKPLAARVPDVLVVVAGAGPEEQRLRERVSALAADDRVRLLGHRSDIGRLLAGADAFCLPSRHEGVPLSVLEAMRAALPCVATAVGGIPTLIDDGRTGLLVPPSDPAALAEALGRVLTDEPLARSLGRAAADNVERNYSLERVARRYADVYREALDRAALG